MKQGATAGAEVPSFNRTTDGLGSNAIALGADASANGRPQLVGPGNGYSPLHGPMEVPQHVQTRVAFVPPDGRLNEVAALEMADLEVMLSSKRVHADELV